MAQAIIQEQHPERLPEDQISPKTVVMKVVSAKDALLRNWKLILILCLMGYGIGYALDVYLKKPAQYEASILFNLGAGSSPNSQFGQMAGMFGLGGAPDANVYTGENFLYFVNSRPVLERALMKEVQVGDQKKMMANFVIDSSSIKDEEWKDVPKLESFYFTSDSTDGFSDFEHRALNSVVDVVKVATAVYEPDRKSSFLMLTVRFKSELLAERWAKTMLETVEEVYTENQTSKTRKTLRLLQSRADSLESILNGTERNLARQMNYSANIVAPEGQARVTKLQRNSQFITQLYAEASRNVEAMKVSLVQEAPLFTIIEPVKQPLDMKIDEGKRAQIGLLIGLVLAFIAVYFKGVYASVMADDRF
ncbi:hypothetical protein [Persicitalea sp.]|uniref:hypothetical protein n=1 Tax=Persicitalea sp. TaxID=3100273 RepID=UPI0035941216